MLRVQNKTFMNLDLAEKIVALLTEYPVSEIAVEIGGSRVHALRPLQAAPPPAAALSLPPEHSPAAAEAAAASALPTEAARLLTSPMVGIFYHAEPPLAVGMVVQAGQAIGSIESMKLMNDVLAEAGGCVSEILADDGAPVDYGRPLFRLTA